MNRITNWMKEYAATQNFQPMSTSALKSMNYLMAIQAAVIGIFLMGPGDLFLQPTSPPDAFWLAPSFFGFDIWETIFVIGSIILAVATMLLKGVKAAHTVMAVVWLAFGIIWTLGGILTSPSYLFGVGILGVFMGLMHVNLIGLWRAEGA